MAATTLLIMTDFRIYEIEIDLLEAAPAAQESRHSRSRLILAPPLSSRRSEICSLRHSTHYSKLHDRVSVQSLSLFYAALATPDTCSRRDVPASADPLGARCSSNNDELILFERNSGL